MPILPSDDAWRRVQRAVRAVERGRRPEAAGTRTAAEPVWARVTSGTADGDGHYPAVLTLPDAAGDWQDYSAVRVAPLNGETLSGGTRYAVRPSGRTAAGEELYTTLAAVSTAAPGNAEVLYVSGPEHEDIADVHLASVRPYDWSSHAYTTVGATTCWAYDPTGNYGESGYYLGVYLGLLDDTPLYAVYAPVGGIDRVGNQAGGDYTPADYYKWVFDYDSGFRFAEEGSIPSNNLVTSIAGASKTQGGIVTANTGAAPNQYFGPKGFYDYLEVASPLSQALLSLASVQFVATLGSGGYLRNPAFAVIDQAEPANPDHEHEQASLEFDFANGLLKVGKGRATNYGGFNDWEWDDEFALSVNGHGGVWGTLEDGSVVSGGIITGIGAGGGGFTGTVP